MIFRRNSTKIQTSKSHHGEANCIKKHDKIDDLSSKFEHELNREKIDTPKIVASKNAGSSRTRSGASWRCPWAAPGCASSSCASWWTTRKCRNCIKKHDKIDDFSSKFEQKLNQTKIDTAKVIATKSTPKLMAKSKRTICPLAYQSDDTPKLIASKSTPKSMIFRRNSTKNSNTKESSRRS